MRVVAVAGRRVGPGERASLVESRRSLFAARDIKRMEPIGWSDV